MLFSRPSSFLAFMISYKYLKNGQDKQVSNMCTVVIYVFMLYSNADSDHILRKLQPRGMWFLTVLGSVATSQRKYVALHAFRRLNSQVNAYINLPLLTILVCFIDCFLHIPLLTFRIFSYSEFFFVDARFGSST